MSENAKVPCEERLVPNAAGNRMICRSAIALGTIAFIVATIAVVKSHGAEGASKLNDAPLTYRRIYVPANAPTSWPRGEEKYLPIEASDFNSWISAANKGSSADAGASINVAEYSGRLEEDGRLEGHGRWDVLTRSGEATLIRVPPPSIAITKLHWAESDKQPVKFGIWGQTGGNPDTWGLLIPTSGSIEFDWEVRGHQQNDALEIPWRVPNATTNRLTLDLPGGEQPTIQGAALLASTAIAPSKSSAKPRQRWQLAVPASADATLQIANPAASKNASIEQPSFRETVNYQLQQRGLNIAASWSLDFRGSAQHELTIPIPNGVELISVTADGHAANWRVDHTESSSAAKAIISLPARLDSSVHQIELAAWQTLTVDRSWQLPRVRPDSVFWSAGQLNVEISHDLELRKVSTTDCSQQSAQNSADEDSGSQVLSFAAYASTATIDVRIARHEPEASVRMCSSLALADPDVTGKLASEWNVSQSSLYKLSGELSPGWSIESVETIPSDALAEWFIDRSNQRRTLEIQLTHPASPGHGVTVIVNGRLQRSSLTEPLSADSLRVVRWSNARVLQHLVAFQSAEPFVAEVVGDLPKVPRNLIGDRERELFDVNANENQVVDLTRASGDAGLRLELRRAEYTAEVELHAICASGELRQNWRVSARPTANAIDRILVYATAPLGDNARWVERFTNNPIIAEAIPSGDSRRKDLPKGGEVWLLRLSQPTTKLIELAVSTTCTLTKRTSPALLALPEAREQHGEVYINGSAGNSSLIEPTALLPIPISAADSNGSGRDNDQAVRAAFRYSAGECLDVNHTPGLSISPSAGNGAASFVVHHLNMESFFWPNGKAQHCATYDLVSDGATEFKPRIPSDAQLSAIIVNHQLLDTTQYGASAVVIPISAAARRTNVRVYFETNQPPLGAVSTLSAPAVSYDFPVLEQEWNVWLPQGFALQSDGQDVSNWRQRLFGPLARANSLAPSDPLQFADSQFSVISAAAANENTLQGSSPASGSESAIPSTSSSASENVPGDSVQSASRQGDSAAERIGWHKVIQGNFASRIPTPIVVTEPAIISSWEIGALIVSLLLAKGCSIRSRWLLIASAVVACFALMLPDAIAPLATGALWGFVVAGISNLIPARTTTNNSAHSAVTRGSFIGGALIAVAFFSRSAIADPDSAPLPKQPSSVSSAERVLIPVDADKKPVGSKYFVGERFLHRLLDRQTKERGEDEAWVLRDASYVGELSDTRDASEVTVGRWSLTFSIETLVRDTTVSLPLVKAEAEWQATAMLEGVPVPVEWRDNGHKCAVVVAQPGRYSLTLFCTPNSTNVGDHRRFSLSIPQLASAIVELHAPAMLSSISIADAIVAPTTKDAPRAIHGELIQARQIAVDWPRLKEKNSGSQGLNVTELKLLRVSPSGVELEAKYVLEGGSRQPDFLTVKYDPRWKPDVRPKSRRDDEAEQSLDGLRTLSIPLSASEGDRQEGVVRWKLDGAPAIGSIRVPSVFLASPQPTQRWLALSVDPSLECALGDSNTSTATTNEFITRWGKFVDTPSIATVVTNFNADHVWTMSTRPHEVESSFHEILHVAVGSHTSRVIYEASVTPSNADKFGLRLAVPANLAIDEINVAEADRQIRSHWVLDGESHVNVFFDGAARSDYHLTLSGTSPCTLGAPFPLPRVTASASTSPLQVQLYRDDDVEVNLQNFPVAADSKPPSAEPPPIQWLVRPVGAFRLDDNEVQKARLVVNSSQAPLTGDMLTSLSHEGGGWWVTVNLRLISQGNLDIVRLNFPPSCLGPFEIESSVAESKETAASSDGGQILGIRFNSTVIKNSTVELKIRSPFMVAPSSAVVVPTISTLLPLSGHRYIGIPTELKNEPLTWSETGVQAATVPRQLTQGISGSQARFEIVKEPILVSSRPRAIKVPEARVRLVDTSATLSSNGAQTIVSSFVISPDGISECTLQLPADHLLLFAELDGRAAVVTPTAPSQWRVLLNATELPQVLEVVSRIESKTPIDDGRELTRATLSAAGKPLPVEVSLWSISQPAGSDHVAIVGASPVSAIDQAVLRFERLVSIAESASSSAAEAPQPDGANWFRPWAARLKAVHQQSSQLIVQQAAATSVARLSRSAEEQLGQIQKRFEKWLEESTDLFGNASSSSESLASELASVKGDATDRKVVYYASQGNGEQLTLQTIKATSSTVYAKLAAMIFVVLFAGLWISKMPWVRDFFYRFPFVVGVLIGIAYWAWLIPSWFGLLIAAANACFALRFTWPGRFLRPEASTVLRSTRTT